MLGAKFDSRYSHKKVGHGERGKNSSITGTLWLANLVNLAVPGQLASA